MASASLSSASNVCASVIGFDITGVVSLLDFVVSLSQLTWFKCVDCYFNPKNLFVKQSSK